MPIGELAVLASAMMFSVTGIIQKTLVTRFRPLTLGALGAGGGAVAGLIFTLTTSDITDITRVPTTYLVLGIMGGIINIGLGEPLYLLFPEKRGREQGMADDCGTPVQLFPSFGDIRARGDANRLWTLSGW